MSKLLNLFSISAPKMIKSQKRMIKGMGTRKERRTRRKRPRGKLQAPQLQEGEALSTITKMLSPLVCVWVMGCSH
jgi:hypothetical protein